MPKNINSMKNVVMDRIHHDNIKMRPRMYYVFGSLLLFLGCVSSILTSVFLVSLIRFSLREHGPMGEYRLAEMISRFPWWAVAAAVIGLMAGIWMLRKYDFSYKSNGNVFIIGFVIAVILAGWLVDFFGLNAGLSRRGRAQGMINPSFQDSIKRHEFGQKRFF